MVVSSHSNSFPVDEQMNMKSVVEYFQEMYGFTIRYSHLPCLQVGNQRKVNYLPMEVGSHSIFLQRFGCRKFQASLADLYFLTYPPRLVRLLGDRDIPKG